ncbi:hypothetical protein APUTEX25_001156 [Auxenochlorella protothecoides]|uniref:Uncharacterized protein n=1 Tax=Auxenochlorella protothecoides TaxID=3075 RepID=A0A3M7KRP2_AUXPR|nr:hypothetical protein APUTEX25_001156 [Auxenochlorella protothecoides]|eukprot:RMZ53037.1 hypothetical protein APUTEX25_001156 [Auxenochlorella protothecoides]
MLRVVLLEQSFFVLSSTRDIASQGTHSLRFRRLYQRADLPIAVEQDRPGRTGLRWTQPLDQLDVPALLPIFVDGLIEEQEPYRMLAEAGTTALIARGGEAVPQCIPHLIVPLKAALSSDRPRTVLRALSTLRALALSSPAAGVALLGYHRHLLPVLDRRGRGVVATARPHAYMHHARCPGASIAGSGHEMQDAVWQTLGTLDATAGRDALRSIQYFIPVYHRI